MVFPLKGKEINIIAEQLVEMKHTSHLRHYVCSRDLVGGIPQLSNGGM